MPARRAALAVALAALLLGALAIGGLGRSSDGAEVGSGSPCHVQVNCAGQVANTPLGASLLPVVAALVAAAAVPSFLVSRRPARGHGRLAAERLLRPPQLLG